MLHKVNVQLFSHGKKLLHNISSVHSFLSARFSSFSDAGVAWHMLHLTWLPSPSAEGPPCRPHPPLSWLLEATKDRNANKLISFRSSQLIMGSHFEWQISSQPPSFFFFFLKKPQKGCAFLRGDINQIISLPMAHNPLQHPLATASHNSWKKTKLPYDLVAKKERNWLLCQTLTGSGG